MPVEQQPECRPKCRAKHSMPGRDGSFCSDPTLRSTQNSEPTNPRTHEPTNPRTQQPANLRTYEPTNLRTRYNKNSINSRICRFPMMQRTLIAFALGAAALQAPVLRAQGPQAPPSVTFSVEVNYVDVDVVVTDEKGNFVPGLTRDDFEVFEDGKPQKVDTFAYVEIPLEQDNAFLLGGRPISSDTKSNRVPFGGRLYVLILDDQDVAAMRTSQVKKSAKEFVDKYMGANDVAAVIHTSGRTDAAQEFTNNKALLHAAIDKFVGRRMRSLTIERLDSYYQSALPSNQEGQGTESEQQPSTDPGGYSRMEPTEMERGFRALGVLDT